MKTSIDIDSQTIQNQYTKQYEQFLQIPQSQRVTFNKNILKVSMENSDLQLPPCNPTFYEKILAHKQKNLNLVIYVWETDDPKNIVFINHGLNGNCQAFQQLAKQISEQTSSVVIGHDTRHFGRSDGIPRGLVGNINNLFEDEELIIQWGLKKYGQKLNIYLLGLSMGGRIALEVSIRNKFKIKGVIFLSPQIVQNPVSKLNLGFLGKIKTMFCPYSPLVYPTYRSGCRHGKFVQSKVKTNPYIYHGPLRAGTYTSLQKLFSTSQTSIKKFQLPYLFIQSEVDKVIDPFQIRDFSNWVSSIDKTNFFVKNMWHSVVFDKQFQNIIPQIVKWIQIKSS